MVVFLLQVIFPSRTALFRGRISVQDLSNQECESDGDCEVVHVGCAPMDHVYCGQIAMSAEAAQSEEWAAIQSKLDACDPWNCHDMCTGGLSVHCNDDGYCIGI